MTQPSPPCPYCGESIAAGTRRCPHCGEHLVSRPRSTAPAGDTRLKAAGVIQVVLGLLAGMAVPCMGFALLMQSALPPAQRQPMSGALAGLLMYGGLSAFFVSTGVGAWRHRRWARPVMLSVAVPGLFMGVAAMVSMVLIYPAMMKASFGLAAGGGGAAAPPPGLLTGIMVVTLLISATLYVGIPALLVFLYWSPGLKAVCEDMDPTPRWTDGVPIPVLAIALWLGLAAAGSLCIPAYGVVPVFGTLITGWAAALYALVLAGAAAGAAVAVFRRSPAGWFGALAWVAVVGASHVVSFSRVSMLDLYRAMDMPPAQLQLMEAMDLTTMTQVMMGVGGVALVATLGFLLHARVFFFRPDDAAAAPPSPPAG